MAPYHLSARADEVGARDDLSATIIACASVMTVLSALAVGLRFYVRGRLLRTYAVEDWCIFAAWVFAAVSDGCTIREAQVALGRRIAYLSAERVMAYLQASYIMALFYNLSLCFTKISILLLYLRVLKTYDYTRKAIHVTLGIVIIYNTWALAMYFSMCIPIAKMWDASITDGYCHPRDVWWALTYIHIITDFMIFVLPIPVILSMTLPVSRKLGLLAVFCVGFFVCLISVLRAIWLKALYDDVDITWDLTAIANWSVAEINVAIVCACLTTLKPLLKTVFGPLRDRISPPQRSLEISLGGRPLTIGSVPMKNIRIESVGTATTVIAGSASSEDGEPKPHPSFQWEEAGERGSIDAPRKAHARK